MRWPPDPSKNLTGRKFGFLTIVEELPRTTRSNGASERAWYCQCECGKFVRKTTSSLIAKHLNPSCGCILLGKNRHRQKKARERRYTPEQISWKAMRSRCLNPNHHSYKNY